MFNVGELVGGGPESARVSQNLPESARVLNRFPWGGPTDFFWENWCQSITLAAKYSKEHMSVIMVTFHKWLQE